MELIYILTLLNIHNLGIQTLKSLINSEDYSIDSKGDLLSIIENLKRYRSNIIVPNKIELETAYKKAEEIIELSEKNKIKIIKFSDSEYPKRLLSVKDHPIIIYTRGNVEILNKQLAIAIVGTRNPTQYGKKYSRDFGKIFSQNGFSIVSGLAKGCDTEAHKGCLELGGKTIAVLAQGLSKDEIMPKRNIKLAYKIMENDGCLISEYPIGQIQSNAFYIQRNRIQSGLCEATTVVETDEKGGTMYTAKFCINQNRILACLKPPEEQKYANSFMGNKILIEKKSAFILENLSDIKNLIDEINSNHWNHSQQLF